MLESFNNIWIIIISIIIFFIIIKKIYNLNKPFDEIRFIQQCANQEKLKKKFTENNYLKTISNITDFYIGVNTNL
jgi:hypothetical protein